jgi:DNA-binding IclR family transcriptional regulator
MPRLWSASQCAQLAQAHRYPRPQRRRRSRIVTRIPSPATALAHVVVAALTLADRTPVLARVWDWVLDPGARWARVTSESEDE